MMKVVEAYKNGEGWIVIDNEFTTEQVREMFEEYSEISILDGNSQIDFGKQLFNSTYPTKQIIFNNCIDKAKEKITKETFINLDEIRFEIGSLKNIKANGLYKDGKIIIEADAIIKGDESIITDIIIHEIGHYVHDKKLDFKEFRFSTINRSEYSKTNYLENFAEAFKDFINNKFNTKERNEKMRNILYTI